MGDARRRSLAVTTPSNLRARTAPPVSQPRIEQRTCLMSMAGQCRVQFIVAGSEGRFMCHRHWALVPEDIRQQLLAQFKETTEAFKAWQQCQQDAVTAVRKASGTID
jgi:hypothetical protein